MRVEDIKVGFELSECSSAERSDQSEPDWLRQLLADFAILLFAFADLRLFLFAKISEDDLIIKKKTYWGKL